MYQIIRNFAISNYLNITGMQVKASEDKSMVSSTEPVFKNTFDPGLKSLIVTFESFERQIHLVRFLF